MTTIPTPTSPTIPTPANLDRVRQVVQQARQIAPQHWPPQDVAVRRPSGGGFVVISAHADDQIAEKKLTEDPVSGIECEGPVVRQLGVEGQAMAVEIAEGWGIFG